jgi:hypothetical protein
MKNSNQLLSYAIYIVLALCSFAAWYLSMAFVTLEFNIIEWPENYRLLLILESVITFLGASAIRVISAK